MAYWQAYESRDTVRVRASPVSYTHLHQTPPKNADAAEYHRATALEALVGYLFVTGQMERMEEILKLALEDDHEKR